jgi:hypothetical protein
MITTIRSVAAVVLLLSALAACSANAAEPSGVASLESESPANASAEPSASLSPEDAQLAFAECMRDHGIDVPDPETGGGGGGGAVRIGGRGENPEEFQAAMEECNEFLEAAGNFRGEPDPEQFDRMLEFAQCMRENGIDMPDPQAGGGIRIQRNDNGNVTNGAGEIDPESPEFQAAEEACRPILGDSGPDGDGPEFQTNREEAQP